MVFKKFLIKLRNKLQGEKIDCPTSLEDEIALRDEMRMIQEQKKRRTHNFGNAGGLNQPTDFNRGFGGRAVDDHLNRSPKDNP